MGAFGTVFTNIINYLNPLSENFILSGLLDRLNPSSNNFILSGINNFFSQLISYLNPFSENFFVYKLLELLGDLLEYLFIPSQTRLNAISNAITSKFGFIDTIKTTITSLQSIMNNLTDNAQMSYTVESKYYSGEIPIVNFSWYRPFKPYGDLIIAGFCYLFFIWRMFIHAPNTIHGLGGDISISTKNFNIKGGK